MATLLAFHAHPVASRKRASLAAHSSQYRGGGRIAGVSGDVFDHL
ncbi:hypothetical protein [Amycolatopsis nigrescens]|nr:hypothetical protein [Amycolatopsis nigrescens]